MSYAPHLLRERLGPNQACTLFGASPGDYIIKGRSYIATAYKLNADDLWRRNFVVLLGFFIFFQLLQMFIIELYPRYSFNLLIPIYAKENEETRKRNHPLKEKKSRSIKDTSSTVEHEVVQDM